MKGEVALRTRASVAAFFFLNGAVFGNWVPRIPEVQEHLGLDNAQLGVGLLGMAAGALLALPLAGALVEKLGSRQATFLAALAYSLAIMIPAASASLATLAAGLFVFGAFNAILDVGMNAQGVGLERLAARPYLPYFHAAFSMGTLLGVASGTTFAAAGIPPLNHLLVVAAGSVLLTLLASQGLLPEAAQSPGGPRSPVRPTKLLLTLGVIGFCALLAEGAVADWSAVYLSKDLEAKTGLAGVGYAAFASTMVLGRLSGASLTRLLGPVTLVRGGGVLTVIGAALVVFPGTIAAAVAGFACMGAALACVFPLVLSAAGRAREAQTGRAIATVSVMGYTGFLAGPPTIGFVAQASSLAGALTIVGVLGLIILVLGRAA